MTAGHSCGKPAPVVIVGRMGVPEALVPKPKKETPQHETGARKARSRVT